MTKKPLILRSPEMDARYRAIREKLPQDDDPFEERAKEDPIKTWQHWLLFENIYPYDAVADVHHLLVSARKFSSPSEMLPQERDELDAIKLELRDK